MQEKPKHEQQIWFAGAFPEKMILIESDEM
jgi:hypothetical protein